MIFIALVLRKCSNGGNECVQGKVTLPGELCKVMTGSVISTLLSVALLTHLTLELRTALPYLCLKEATHFRLIGIEG